MIVKHVKNPPHAIDIHTPSSAQLLYLSFIAIHIHYVPRLQRERMIISINSVHGGNQLIISRTDPPQRPKNPSFGNY